MPSGCPGSEHVLRVGLGCACRLPLLLFDFCCAVGLLIFPALDINSGPPPPGEEPNNPETIPPPPLPGGVFELGE